MRSGCRFTERASAVGGTILPWNEQDGTNRARQTHLHVGMTQLLALTVAPLAIQVYCAAESPAAGAKVIPGCLPRAAGLAGRWAANEVLHGPERQVQATNGAASEEPCGMATANRAVVLIKNAHLAAPASALRSWTHQVNSLQLHAAAHAILSANRKFC